VTGKLPFQGDYEMAVVYSIVNVEPKPPTSVRTGVPMQLEQVIHKLLAKDPDARYQHCDDVIVDLQAVAGTPDERAGKPTSKRRRVALIAGALARVVALGFVAVGKLGPAPEVNGAQIKNSIAVLPFVNMLGRAFLKQRNPPRNPLPCKELQKGLDFVPRTGFDRSVSMAEWEAGTRPAILLQRGIGGRSILFIPRGYASRENSRILLVTNIQVQEVTSSPEDTCAPYDYQRGST